MVTLWLLPNTNFVRACRSKSGLIWIIYQGANTLFVVCQSLKARAHPDVPHSDHLVVRAGYPLGLIRLAEDVLDGVGMTRQNMHRSFGSDVPHPGRRVSATGHEQI